MMKSRPNTDVTAPQSSQIGIALKVLDPISVRRLL